MGQSLTKNYIHIIFGTKNNFPFIKSPVESKLHSYIGGMCRKLECTPVKVGGYTDHVHIVCLLFRPYRACDASVLLSMGFTHRFYMTPLRGFDIRVNGFDELCPPLTYYTS